MTDVTILITCYKQEQYLPRAIQSALDQVIPFLVKGTQPLPSFTVISNTDEKGIGASAFRNKCIKDEVKSPWIILLDADDELPSHYLWYLWQAKRMLPFKSETKKFVGSPVQFISGLRMDRLYHEGYHTNCDFETYCPNCTVSGLFSREAFDNVGGFDENMRTLNDWDFWLRLARARNNYIHCKDTFVLRRGDVKDSITQKGMASSNQVLNNFNAKNGTSLKLYPSPYEIPSRQI